MRPHHLSRTLIRPATELDAASIAAIHTASWRDAYADILAPEFLSGGIERDRLAVWSERLCNPAPSQLVEVALDSTGHALAFICAYCDFDPRWGSLVDNLHVLPQSRGQGFGAQLFRGLVSQISARESTSGLHLWVFEANVAGLRFYSRLGGRVVARDVSRIPAAGGKPILLVHWPTLAEAG
jgi:ribosomal protein S18 acetylase RimI-like enzyme